METREAKELAISGAALAIAFSVALNGGIQGITSLSAGHITVAFITVSFGFLLHELSHRYVAHRFGSYAEYRMWPQGLALALLFSFLGFVFAAPGAVMIHERSDLWGRSRGLSLKRSGIISLAGPLTNIVLAIAFTVAGFLYPIYSAIAGFGASINIWLALFNMIPVPPLDGSKVFQWDKKIWAAALSLIIMLWIFL